MSTQYLLPSYSYDIGLSLNKHVWYGQDDILQVGISVVFKFQTEQLCMITRCAHSKRVSRLKI